LIGPAGFADYSAAVRGAGHWIDPSWGRGGGSLAGWPARRPGAFCRVSWSPWAPCGEAQRRVSYRN